uniref:CCHC-type domain-containing protein n=1 Tax=Cuerna arida TaxID=1464854 RepID=A0A1B6H477_9HEMI
MQGKVGLSSTDSLHVIKKKGYSRPKSYYDGKSHRPNPQNNKPGPSQGCQSAKTGQTYKCLKCGTEHTRANCPAYGKICKKCGQKNHFAVGCQANKNKSQPKRTVHETKVGLEEVEDLFISALFQDDFTMAATCPKDDAIQSKERQRTSTPSRPKEVVEQISGTDKVQMLSWMQPVIINNQTVNFKLDSGAQCNVLPSHVLDKLKLPKVRLEHNQNRILSYDNQELNCLGNVILDSEVNGVNYKIKYVVVKTKSVPILGLNACVKLNLLQRVNSLQLDSESLASKDKFVNKYKEVFTSVGKFPKKFSLELKENAKPVVNSVRRIPESVKPKLKEVLDRLIDNNIIEPVDYPTDWVNNIVIVEKPDKSLRICLDPAQLNECIKLDPFPIPSADE